MKGKKREEWMEGEDEREKEERVEGEDEREEQRIEQRWRGRKKGEMREGKQCRDGKPDFPFFPVLPGFTQFYQLQKIFLIIVLKLFKQSFIFLNFFVKNGKKGKSGFPSLHCRQSSRQ